MITPTTIEKMFVERSLGATLNASSAIIKVLIESLSVQDAQALFCEDSASRALLSALAAEIQRGAGTSVSTLTPIQRDEIVKFIDRAVASVTREVTHFKPSRAKRKLERLRHVAIDLA
jgi:hypothetical protein